MGASVTTSSPPLDRTEGNHTLEKTTQGNSTKKDNLKTAWHGVELLLKKVEKLLAGTQFQTPFAAVNVLIELGNVCPFLSLYATWHNGRPQAVVDNRDALEELVTRTAERLAIVNTALLNEGEAVSREMIERFAGCVQCYFQIFRF